MKDLISLRRLLAMLLTGVFFASCTPYPPEGPPRNPAQVPTAEAVNPAVKKKVKKTTKSESARQAEANRKRLASKKRAAKRRAAQKKRDAAAWKKKQEAKVNGATDTVKPPVVKKKVSKYPTASVTRKGFVKNPYTGNEVDVRGIPGGRLVFDPDDPNKATNKFRVP